jgi:hypothetical protein
VCSVSQAAEGAGQVSEQNSAMPDAFDRLRGLLTGLPNVLQTQPSTIMVSTPLLGTTDTYIVETFRQREEPTDDGKQAAPPKDTIFLIAIRPNVQPIRLPIPWEVANAIARQRDALTTRTRKAGARKAAATRKARGVVPNTAGLAKHRKAKAKR